MDIFILNDGKEIGPFSDETAQTLINQGTVAATDLAWRSGMENWAPLGEMLALANQAAAPATPTSSCQTPTEPTGRTEAGAPSSANDAPAEAAPAPEPATAKQMAFLRYLGIAFSEDLSKERASILINDAMENPALAEQIAKWSADRLRLHPDLFAAEVHARKENRAAHFFEICQTEGAQYFTRITKAHCQVLVGFLDAKFPAWDSRMEDAATNYFFPAIGEKFPQLIERHWKDRFHYAEAPGTESARQAPAARVPKRHVTPLEAVARGLALGVAILAALYFGQKMLPRWMGRHPAETEQSENASPPLTAAPNPGVSSAPVSPAANKKKEKAARRKAAVENSAAASRSTPAPAEDSTDASASPKAETQSSQSPPSEPAPSAPPASDTPAPAAPPL